MAERLGLVERALLLEQQRQAAHGVERVRVVLRRAAASRPELVRW
jgi:hypothetical protein